MFIMNLFNENFLFIKKYLKELLFRVYIIIVVKFNTDINLQFEFQIHIQVDHEWKKDEK